MEREDLRRRVDELEAINAGLLNDVRDLAAKHDAVPGVVEHRKDWYVLVGGERVELKAIPPAEWIQTLEELPAFLFSFAVERSSKPTTAPSSKALEEVTTLARRWLTACAVDLEALKLDRLTLVEAEHAVAHIAELNGVTAALRTWFREQLARVATGAPGSAVLRSPTVEPAGDQPN